MKKIIYIVGIVFLAIVTILNLLFTATLSPNENITINFNSFLYSIAIILVVILIFFITKKINENKECKQNTRKKILIIFLIIYFIFNILWLVLVRPGIVADSIHVCNLAQTINRKDTQEFLNNLTYIGIPLSQYIEAYPQQISLAFIFSCFFKITYFDNIHILKTLNFIGIAVIVYTIYKIGKQLSKKYETNNILLFTLILTFITLPMLSTFIYGDIPSLALCLLSVYFMMKYTETKKKKYFIFASISTMVAYMMRMNSLIFIIATIIYLVLNLFNDFSKKGWKEKILSILIIITYICISILPAKIVSNYYLDKYNLSNDKTYPFISYFLMAMEESGRGNGWYNESIAEPALKNPENIKDEYSTKIKERIEYFSKEPKYTFNFYIMKIASMWTENTYSAIYNNMAQEDYNLGNITKPLSFYQKSLLLLTCISIIIFLIQNRKNISLEVLFLLTIFIGGFAFHILWEAKSRYIIPYVVVLIPLAALKFNIPNIKEYINRKKTAN